jgi:hypothetical protein
LRLHASMCTFEAVVVEEERWRWVLT